MEWCFQEFPTREEVVRILKERQLQIPNIDHLPDEELTRIYRTFAVPLGKREGKSSTSSNHCSDGQTEGELLRTTKRHYMLDVNLADLDLNEKRTKLSTPNEISFALKKRWAEDFNRYHSTKKRKITTWP